ncbi:MAG: hypothetical protein WCF23_18915 [Candidatus Nitrosopolaris sp.]
MPDRTRLLENRDEIINEIRRLNNSGRQIIDLFNIWYNADELQVSLRFIEESGREASKLKR